MCTAIALHGESFLFGRNMDLDWNFDGEILITPRNMPFSFLEKGKPHYAIIGMAKAVDNYPLYADAANERGLCIAGLHFPQSGHYFSEAPEGSQEIASFELIPWILSTCATVEEALSHLQRACLVDRPFCKDIPTTPLHWIVADQHHALTVEPTVEGLKVYQNSVGILTNEPPFPFHMENRKYYQGLSAEHVISDAGNNLLPLGTASIGLPGDYSSISRFVKADFLLRCAENEDTVYEAGDLFRLLQAVAPTKGSVRLQNGKSHHTVYSCCMEPLKGIYHFQTYDGLSTTTKTLFSYPLETDSLIFTNI